MAKKIKYQNKTISLSSGASSSTSGRITTDSGFKRVTGVAVVAYDGDEQAFRIAFRDNGGELQDAINWKFLDAAKVDSLERQFVPVDWAAGGNEIEAVVTPIVELTGDVALDICFRLENK